MRAMFEYRPDVQTDDPHAAPRSASEPGLTTLHTADGDGAVIELHRDAICGIQGAERFEVQEVIASGGQGTVFRASNRDNGQTVAIKVFHQSCLDSQRALKDEFRSLARLRHPGIVRMYELHVGDDYAFFTMEHVEGSELDSYLRAALSGDAEPTRAQYWGVLRLVITQLAIAIQAAHSAGLLHLDIKPGNVRVTEQGRVVLLDFGLVRNARQRAGMLERSGGTPPYMAPEQLGGHKVSDKTDWYALGAVLSQLLSAEPRKSRIPAKRAAAAERDTRLPDVPEDLGRLCDALLQFDPEARPSGREVLARLGALTPRSGSSGVGSERIVGREAELAALQQLFDSHQRGHWKGTTLVKLSGAPGVGKTSLLRDFLERLLREDAAHVFWGRCFERAMVPYRLLDELMDQLAEAARRLRISSELDVDQLALGRMFRSFASEPSWGDPGAYAPPRADEITPKALRALTRILRKVAEDGRPLVLWLDDVQWTDMDSVPLLLALLARNTTPLIVLFSGHAFDASLPLERGLDELVQTHEHIRLFNLELSGLSATEAGALIEQLDPSQLTVRDRIWQQASGNPLQIAELLRHSYVAELPAETGAPLSVPLAQLYIGRIAHLGQRARSLLELAALSNQPLPSTLLMAAEGGDPHETAPLAELRRAAFIDADDGPVVLAHDTIRKSVRSYLSPTRQRWAHSLLAAAHMAHDPHAHELLAYHFEGAGDIEACILHLRKGAEASAVALAFVRAAALYQRAYELLGDRDPEQRGSLREHQAESIQNATDVRSRADLLVVQTSDTHGEMARSLALRVIELNLLAGHFEEAEPALRKLLDEVGLPTFRSEQGALLRGLVELASIAVQGLPEHSAPRGLDDLSRMRLEVCQAALRGYSTSATFRGAVYGVILLRLACQAGEVPRIVLASMHVSGFLTFSNLRWAKQYARKLLDRAEHLAQGDVELVALVESGRGIPELFSGQWRSAYAKLSPSQAGSRYASRFGPEWILAGQMSLIALDQLGELEQLALDAQPILESGVAQGNRMVSSETRLWCALVDIARDRIDEARLKLALAEPFAPKNSFLFVHWCMLRLRTQILLYEGDYRQALLVLRRERRALRGSGLLTIQFIRVLASQMEAVALCAEAVSGRMPRDQAAARLDTLAQVVARDEAAYARATHCVVRASALLVRGRLPAALHELQRADGFYVAADMALHAAAMRLCARMLSGETDEVCPEEQLMQQLGVQVPRRWVRCLAPCSSRR
jgi:eukaryotic-like serine/threonine-protein kinase